MPPQPATIAVVDDDDGVRLALTRLLRASGFATASYRSGEEYLDGGAVRHADCLVLDIQLGGMTGFDLYRRLAERGAPPPVIFVTGHDSPANRQRALEAGSVAFLRKPVPADDLLDAVGRALATGAADRP